MVYCSDEAMYTVDDKMLHTLAYTLAYLFGLPLVLWILRLLGSKRASSRELRAIHERVSMRMRLTMLLYVQTRVGLCWEIVQSGAAFLSCLFYIMSTYDDDCLPLGSRTLEMAAEARSLLRAAPVPLPAAPRRPAHAPLCAPADRPWRRLCARLCAQLLPRRRQARPLLQAHYHR